MVGVDVSTEAKTTRSSRPIPLGRYRRDCLHTRVGETPCELTERVWVTRPVGSPLRLTNLLLQQRPKHRVRREHGNDVERVLRVGHLGLGVFAVRVVQPVSLPRRRRVRSFDLHAQRILETDGPCGWVGEEEKTATVLDIRNTLQTYPTK